jgi:hypothetical protein
MNGLYLMLQIFINGSSEELTRFEKGEKAEILKGKGKKERLDEELIIYTYTDLPDKYYPLFLDAVEGIALTYPQLEIEAHLIQHFVGHRSFVKRLRAVGSSTTCDGFMY